MSEREVKILIVDDFQYNIQIVRNVLEQEGYKIDACTNSVAAINKVFNGKYDLILLDILMPEMDGFEICTIIKSNQDTKNIPIIFLTAIDEDNNINKGFKVGAVDYIIKPFRSQELVSRVKAHLTIKFQQEELMMQNATKDKFFSIIAHDLKNPFNQIIGFSDLLLRKIQNDEKEKSIRFAQEILTASKNTYILLENLLEWSLTQTNRIVFLPS